LEIAYLPKGGSRVQIPPSPLGGSGAGTGSSAPLAALEPATVSRILDRHPLAEPPPPRVAHGILYATHPDQVPDRVVDLACAQRLHSEERPLAIYRVLD